MGLFIWSLIAGIFQGLLFWARNRQGYEEAMAHQ